MVISLVSSMLLMILLTFIISSTAQLTSSRLTIRIQKLANDIRKFFQMEEMPFFTRYVTLLVLI